MTKKELTKKCQKILYKKDITIEDKKFLTELLMNHPDAKKKIGTGIKNFFIKKNNYGGKGFNILRLDGSTTDFSFIKCITHPTQKLKTQKACRTAIKSTILANKKDKTKIVHHDIISFNTLVQNWIKECNPIDLTTNKSIDNCQETYFINANVENSFKDYHNKYAVLKEVTIEEHKKIHKKMR